MQFRVPQFIDVEDTLVGPFTFKQFLYCIGSLGLCFVIWNLIPIRIVALVLIAPVAGLGIALAFVPVNGKPFIFILEAVFRFYTKNHLYIWRKLPRIGIMKTASEKEKEEKEAASVLTSSLTPRLSNSKLRELGWGLDVYDTHNK